MSSIEQRLAGLSPERLELLRARLQNRVPAQDDPAQRPEPPPLPTIEPHPEDRHRPFPLTEVQEAYWIGRSRLFDLARGADSYLEYDIANADERFVDRLEWALQEFIQRHDMLRAVVLPGGQQQVHPQVPPLRIARKSLEGLPSHEVEAALQAARDRLRNQTFSGTQWPLLEVLCHYLDGHRVRVHLVFDALLKEGRSRGILLEELPRLFENPDAALTPLSLTYRDFAASRKDFEETELFRRSEAYWMKRIPSLPGAPALPAPADSRLPALPRFTSRQLDLLSLEAWQTLKARTARAGLTPSSVLLTVFIDVIAAWSETPAFSLGLIGTDRPEVHPQINDLFGNFNTLFLFAVDDRSGTFRERVRRYHHRLTTDLGHRHFSGFRVLRELNRRAGGSPRAALPVFFNSVVEHGPVGGPGDGISFESSEGEQPSMTEIEGSVHFPQILILPTFLEFIGRGLVCKWQAVEDAFPTGLVDDLTAALGRHLETIAASDAPWDEPVPALLSDIQRQARAGRTLEGQAVRILDERGAPRPDRVAGELWLDERRTGLAARFLPGGEVEVLGRPEEVWTEKSGRRIELRQVEAALERHSDVRTAVVLPRIDGDGRTRLQAFVLGDATDTAEISRRLASHLPPHLLPDIIDTVSELPRAADGTVDRTALAARLRPLPAPPDTRVAPRDDAETALLDIWRELLGPNPFGVTDDFFALGGTSLLVIRLMEKVGQRFGVQKPLHLFFEQPTIEHLAGLVREDAAAREAESLARKSWWSWLRRPEGQRPEAAPAPPPLEGLSAGMRTFLILWAGQLVSALGTTLGSFSLGVWVFEKTGSTTSFALIAVLAGTLTLVVSPMAGVLADRWSRRKIMLISDLGSAVMTVGLASLMFTRRLQLWHVYPFIAAMVILGNLQGPALTASISLLVPRRHLARAAGMSQISRASAAIAGPFLAGILVSAIGYHGVIYIDCATFLFASATILLVRIPDPPGAERGGRRFSILSDLAAGWRYLRDRPGLLALLRMYMLTNFCMGFVQVLLTPMVLSFATPTDLGSVSSAAAGGALLGALALSFWGGPRNRIRAIFAILIIQACILFLGGIQPSIPLIAMAAFGFMFTAPIIGGTNQAVLQSKVAPEVQGRVFGVATFVVACAMPLASAIAGPLVDRVFQPLLSPGGLLADNFIGHLVGVGPGRGAGLLFVLLGAAVLLIVGLAFLNPRLRRLETDLPDAAGGEPDAPQPEPAQQVEAAH